MLFSSSVFFGASGLHIMATDEGCPYCVWTELLEKPILPAI